MTERLVSSIKIYCTPRNNGGSYFHQFPSYFWCSLRELFLGKNVSHSLNQVCNYVPRPRILGSTGKFVCLCFTSRQQRGHLETAPPFSVPCEGREAR